VCLLQAKKAIDFIGYWRVVGASVASGFHLIPYPTGGSATQGDYFQSPVTTFLLVPWSIPPEPAAKFLWALTSLLLIAWLLRVWVREPLGLPQVFFLVLLFAHGLSDVFLSGNINFPLLALLVAGWSLMDRPSALARTVGATCLAVAVYVKVFPLIFLGFFVLTAQWRKAGYVVGALIALPVLTWIALPSGTFLPWWQGWLHALGLYGVATGGPERVSYQSPPAAIFRLLGLLTDLPRARLLLVMNFAALAITGAIFLQAVRLWRRGDAARPWVFPMLLSTFFLGGPYSWALTTLFCFPLVLLAIRSGISRLAWTTAIVLALIPKEIWPKDMWNVIAYWSLPAICLAILMGEALSRSAIDASPKGSPLPDGLILEESRS